jgi:DNA-binding transcriptional LysR family regulator
VLLAQVEAFLEVARRGSLSRAADALLVTQPALTARLQGLEHELGVALFVRSRRGMELTDAGRAFAPYAERAIAALQSGSQLVDELSRGSAGELVVGAAPAVSTYLLPGLLVRFVERHPNVRLVVRTGHSEEILEMAVNNEIQVGLVRELHHPLVAATPLYDDELVLVATPGHAFSGVEPLPIQRIREARLILFDRASSYYDMTSTLFRQAGVSPRGIMELDNIDAAKQMVIQGLGVALLPRTAISAELATGALVAVPIAGGIPLRRRIVAVRRAGLGPPTGVVAAFFEVLEAIRQIAPDASDTSEEGRATDAERGTRDA